MTRPGNLTVFCGLVKRAPPYNPATSAGRAQRASSHQPWRAQQRTKARISRREWSMRRLSAACIVAGLCVLVPSAAFAQGVLTGVVKDASGAVLPGVTVEASSPDLIERVRTAVTDSGGQYRIVDLRAGSYTVSFTLQGFTTVRREGIAIEGTFTATVNADMRVGAVAESVTVSGETPIVDV